MITDFGRVFIFFIIGAVFVAGGLVTAWLVRPSRSYPGKLTSYECGEEPVGGSWVQFNIRFYVLALIFLIFDVEIVFLVPWAVVSEARGLFVRRDDDFSGHSGRRVRPRLGKGRPGLGPAPTQHTGHEARDASPNGAGL